jgi:hypothetical protein
VFERVVELETELANKNAEIENEKEKKAMTSGN